MKKFLFGIICSAILSSSVYSAQGYVFSTDNAEPVIQNSNKNSVYIPYSQYLQFYNMNADKIGADYIYLKHSDETILFKSLSKEDKENYKYVKKIQKLIAKNQWDQVFSQYPNFYPAYLQYYEICYKNEDYTEALRILIKIKNLDTGGNIYSQTVLNKAFAELYYKTRQYSKALQYYQMYETSEDDVIYMAIANCYYNLGEYSHAINYCKKLKNQTYEAKEIIYDSYMRLKDFQNADKYAKELLKMNYSYQNLMRVQAMEKDDSAKLSYCYHARELALEEKDIRAVNKLICDIEQRKLEKSVSKQNQFIKVPKWEEISKQFPPNMTLQEISAKQDEFFKTANNYLLQYKGQQLANAFASLSQEFYNFAQSKQNQYYQEQQILMQQAALEQQQREYELQQQILYEQQMRNYIQRQHYYMNRYRPYYMQNDPFIYPW